MAGGLGGVNTARASGHAVSPALAGGDPCTHVY